LFGIDSELPASISIKNPEKKAFGGFNRFSLKG
jgi:hypothetical protein